MNRKNRWIRTGMNAAAFLMLVSAITSNLFHYPNYSEANESTVIVMACCLFMLSTVFVDEKSHENSR